MCMAGSAASGEASRGRVDDGDDGWREREGTGEMNPIESRPKREIGDTYGFGGTRRSSRVRRRR